MLLKFTGMVWFGGTTCVTDFISKPGVIVRCQCCSSLLSWFGGTMADYISQLGVMVRCHSCHVSILVIWRIVIFNSQCQCGQDVLM